MIIISDRNEKRWSHVSSDESISLRTDEEVTRMRPLIEANSLCCVVYLKHPTIDETFVSYVIVNSIEYIFLGRERVI